MGRFYSVLESTVLDYVLGGRAAAFSLTDALADMARAIHPGRESISLGGVFHDFHFLRTLTVDPALDEVLRAWQRAGDVGLGEAATLGASLLASAGVPLDFWRRALSSLTQLPPPVPLGTFRRFGIWLHFSAIAGGATMDALKDVAEAHGRLPAAMLGTETAPFLAWSLMRRFFHIVSANRLPGVTVEEKVVPDLTSLLQEVGRGFLRDAEFWTSFLGPGPLPIPEDVRQTFLSSLGRHLAARLAAVSLESAVEPPVSVPTFASWAKEHGFWVDLEGVHPELERYVEELVAKGELPESARTRLKDAQEFYNAYALTQYWRWSLNILPLSMNIRLPLAYARPLRWLFYGTLLPYSWEKSEAIWAARTHGPELVKAVLSGPEALPQVSEADLVMSDVSLLLLFARDHLLPRALAKASQIDVADADEVYDIFCQLVINGALERVRKAAESGELSQEADLDALAKRIFVEEAENALNRLEEEYRDLRLPNDVEDLLYSLLRPWTGKPSVMLRYYESYLQGRVLSEVVPELPRLERRAREFSEGLMQLFSLQRATASFPEVRSDPEVLTRSFLEGVGQAAAQAAREATALLGFPSLSNAPRVQEAVLDLQESLKDVKPSALPELITSWVQTKLVPALVNDASSYLQYWPKPSLRPSELFPNLRLIKRLNQATLHVLNRLDLALSTARVRGVVPYEAKDLPNLADRLLGALVVEFGLDPLRLSWPMLGSDHLPFLTRRAPEAVNLAVQLLKEDPEVLAMLDRWSMELASSTWPYEDVVSPRVWQEAYTWAEANEGRLFATTYDAVRQLAAKEEPVAPKPKPEERPEIQRLYELILGDLALSPEAAKERLVNLVFSAIATKRDVEGRPLAKPASFHAALGDLVDDVMSTLFFERYGEAARTWLETGSHPPALSLLAPLADDAGLILEPIILHETNQGGYAAVRSFYSLATKPFAPGSFALGRLRDPVAETGEQRIQEYMRGKISAQPAFLRSLEDLRSLEGALASVHATLAAAVLAEAPQGMSLGRRVLFNHNLRRWLWQVMEEDVVPYLVAVAAEGAPWDVALTRATEHVRERFLTEFLPTQPRPYQPLEPLELDLLDSLTRFWPASVVRNLHDWDWVVSSFRGLVAERLADESFRAELARTLAQDPTVGLAQKTAVRPEMSEAQVEVLRATLQEALGGELRDRLLQADQISGYLEDVYSALELQGGPASRTALERHVLPYIRSVTRMYLAERKDVPLLYASPVEVGPRGAEVSLEGFRAFVEELEALAQDRDPARWQRAARKGLDVLLPNLGLLPELPGAGEVWEDLVPTESYITARLPVIQRFLRDVAEHGRKLLDLAEKNQLPPQTLEGFYGFPYLDAEASAGVAMLQGLFQTSWDINRMLGLRHFAFYVFRNIEDDLLRIKHLFSGNRKLAEAWLKPEEFRAVLREFLDAQGYSLVDGLLTDEQVELLYGKFGAFLDFYGVPFVTTLKIPRNDVAKALAKSYLSCLTPLFDALVDLNPMSRSDLIEDLRAQGISVEEGRLDEAASALSQELTFVLPPLLLAAPFRESVINPLSETVRDRLHTRWLPRLLTAPADATDSVLAEVRQDVLGRNPFVALELLSLFREATLERATERFAPYNTFAILSDLPPEELFAAVFRSPQARLDAALTFARAGILDESDVPRLMRMEPQAMWDAVVREAQRRGKGEELEAFLLELREGMLDQERTWLGMLAAGGEDLALALDPWGSLERLGGLALQSHFGELASSLPPYEDWLRDVYGLFSQVEEPKEAKPEEKKEEKQEPPYLREILDITVHESRALMRLNNPYLVAAAALWRKENEYSVRKAFKEWVSLAREGQVLREILSASPQAFEDLTEAIARTGFVPAETLADLASRKDVEGLLRLFSENHALRDAWDAFHGEISGYARFVSRVFVPQYILPTVRKAGTRPMTREEMPQAVAAIDAEFQSRWPAYLKAWYLTNLKRWLVKGNKRGTITNLPEEVKAHTPYLEFQMEMQEEELRRLRVKLSPFVRDLLADLYISGLFEGYVPITLGNRSLKVSVGGAIFSRYQHVASTALRERYQRRASVLARELVTKALEGLPQEVDLFTLQETFRRVSAELSRELDELELEIYTGLPSVAEILRSELVKSPEERDPWQILYAAYIHEERLTEPIRKETLGTLLELYATSSAEGTLGRDELAAAKAQALVQTGIYTDLRDVVYRLYELGERLWRVGKYATCWEGPGLGLVAPWLQPSEVRQRRTGEMYLGTADRLTSFSSWRAFDPESATTEAEKEVVAKNRALLARIAAAVGDPRLLEWLDIGIWAAKNDISYYGDRDKIKAMARAFADLYASGKVQPGSYWERAFLLWDKIVALNKDLPKGDPDFSAAQIAMRNYLEDRKPVATGEILSEEQLDAIWRGTVVPLLRKKRTELEDQELLFLWANYIWPAAEWERRYGLSPKWTGRSLEVVRDFSFELMPKPSLPVFGGLPHLLGSALGYVFKDFLGWLGQCVASEVLGYPLLTDELLERARSMFLPIVREGG